MVNAHKELLPKMQPPVSKYRDAVEKLPHAKFFNREMDIDATFKNMAPSKTISEIKQVFGLEVHTFEGAVYVCTYSERLPSIHHMTLIGRFNHDATSIKCSGVVIKCFSSLDTISKEELLACVLVNNLWVLAAMCDRRDALKELLSAPTSDQVFIDSLPKLVYEGDEINYRGTYGGGNIYLGYGVTGRIKEYFGVKTEGYYAEPPKYPDGVTMLYARMDGVEKPVRIGAYKSEKGHQFEACGKTYTVFNPTGESYTNPDEFLNLITLIAVSEFLEMKKLRMANRLK